MSAPQVALCLEQTLGHRAHTLNLEAEAARRGGRTRVVRVEYGEPGALATPWALRGSGQAVRRLRGNERAAAVLFHTSTIALGAPLCGSNYSVSVDATPLQLDTMGEWYAHRRMPALAENLKRRWYRAVFQRARRMIAWSNWAAASLVADYGVDASRISIIHPGAGRSFFEIERPERRAPTILFVGGDFERKGGRYLLEAFRALEGRARLVLVTGADVAESEGIRVLRDVKPGSGELLAAYAEADIFCLPTMGDCTSVAIEEAMAAGLPVVTTPVGSNLDTVTADAGLFVRQGDASSLRESLLALVDDASLCRRLGRAARALAADSLDAEVNARRVLDAAESAA